MALILKKVQLPRDNFNLNITADIGDEVTGIFGSSGAGKTSFIHLLAGLEKPTKGSIVFNGRELVNAATGAFVPPYQRRIGLVFQDARLFPHLTVKKNLLFGQKYLPKGVSKPSFNEIVKLLEIKHLLDSQPGNISGGESQRVALARALLSSPELLLLDEPFSAVDFALRKNILPFLWRIRQKLKVPMLVISHDMPDILKLTNRLLLIDKGQVLAHGTISDLMLNHSTFGYIKNSGVVSVFDMKISGFENNDTIILSSNNCIKNVKLYASYTADLAINQKQKVSIAPDDVIISRKPVNDTSARNMLEGKIIGSVESSANCLCQIDIGAGSPLFAEITQESYKRLKLAVNSKVYCMIKANSVILSNC